MMLNLYFNNTIPTNTEEWFDEKVHPTNMADPDLYKAALEYHEIDKFDGPKGQLQLRNIYFQMKWELNTQRYHIYQH